jgi:AAA domain
VQALRCFVVVDGLPGSGKTRLARRLSPVLELPVIDKDDLLEQLFDRKGVGDTAWRRQLSREADGLVRAAAADSTDGAILVSLWHRHGMPSDSGTPVEWLAELSSSIVTVLCRCDARLAASRFVERTRHEGHLDELPARGDIVASIEQLAGLEASVVGEPVTVDTTTDPPLGPLVEAITRASARARTRS